MAKVVKKANTKKAKKPASKSRPKKKLTLVAKNVPEDKVEATTKSFMHAGATKVEKKKQAKGKYSLTAAFPR